MKTIFLYLFILILGLHCAYTQNTEVVKALEIKELNVSELNQNHIKNKLEQDFPFKNQVPFIRRCMPSINKSNTIYFINNKRIPEEGFSEILKKYKIKKIKDIKVLSKVEIKQKFDIDIEDKAILLYTKKIYIQKNKKI